jgi:hypothetical protein
MQFPYLDDDTGAVVGVTLTLHAKCTGDEPVLVTSDDLVSEDNDILPIGHPDGRGRGAGGAFGEDDMDAGARKARLCALLCVCCNVRAFSADCVSILFSALFSALSGGYFDCEAAEGAGAESDVHRAQGTHTHAHTRTHTHTHTHTQRR